MKLSCVVYEPVTSVCCQKIPCIFCSQHYVFTHTSSSLKWYASYVDDSELRSCLCESRGGRPGLPVPNSPYDLCGRKATFEEENDELCSSWSLLRPLFFKFSSFCLMSSDAKKHTRDSQSLLQPRSNT